MSGRSPRRRRPTLAIPVPRVPGDDRARRPCRAQCLGREGQPGPWASFLPASFRTTNWRRFTRPLANWNGPARSSISGIPSRRTSPLFWPVTSGKTLLQRAEERGKFPGPRQRWCTGDFKSSPIARELRRYLKDHPRFEVHLIGAMGLRREESVARAKRVAGKRNDRMSVAGREVL